MSADRRELATCSTYTDLIAVLRARTAELELTHLAPTCLRASRPVTSPSSSAATGVSAE
jgi:hypothetical protein